MKDSLDEFKKEYSTMRKNQKVFYSIISNRSLSFHYSDTPRDAISPFVWPFGIKWYKNPKEGV